MIRLKMRHLLWLASVVALTVLVACDGDDNGNGNGNGNGVAEAENGGGETAAYSYTTPAPGEAVRTGGEIGTAATEEQISLIDIDVVPGGPMPEGSGTVSEGGQVYAANCARCHGVTGTEDGVGPALVSDPGPWEPGMTIAVGSYWPYAETVYDYVRRAMPFDAPGTLSDDDVYAVVAWILYENEIIEEDETMDAETLPAVVMPNRDSFFSCWPEKCRPDVGGGEATGND